MDVFSFEAERFYSKADEIKGGSGEESGRKCWKEYEAEAGVWGSILQVYKPTESLRIWCAKGLLSWILQMHESRLGSFFDHGITIFCWGAGWRCYHLW